MQRNATFTNDYLKKCIYIVNMGSNDYINNYFMPNDYPTSRIYNTDQYAELLARQYSQQLKVHFSSSLSSIVCIVKMLSHNHKALAYWLRRVGEVAC